MFTRRLGWLGVFVVLAAVGSGLLLAQSPQAVGTWVGVGSADNPFGNGAHVDVGDGRTLIVGGTAPDGAATNVVASFDTATNLFTVAGTLIGARTEHTATLLKDGRVLVTGGTTNALVSTDIEIFDPSTGASTLVAQMAEPRRGHVAALLQSGSVLIAGGYTSEGAVLQSAFIFDPATNSISPTPSSMNVARASASATSLIDGRVVIIGGTDGTNDLASAEIYDPALQSFTSTSTQLSLPGHGHAAVLLPHNGSVLVAGGTSNGVAQAGADLFLPAQFPDPFSWGVGQFAPAAAMNAARSSAIAGPSATEGYSVVTGGGSNGVERYRFATIKTDKDDYPPGQTAIITGSGWQPNEEVTLLFQEDPAVHDDYVLTVTADGEGNIHHDTWAPEEHDANVRFYLMATGQQSGRRAQMTFTDSVNFNNLQIGAQAPTWVAQGASATYLVTVKINVTGGGGSTSCTVENFTATGLPGTASPTFSPTSVTSTGADQFVTMSVATGTTPTGTYNGTVQATGSAGCSGNQTANFQLKVGTSTSLTLTAPSPASVTQGSAGPVSLSATLSAGATLLSGQTINFRVDGVPVGTGTTNAGGVATFGYNPSALGIAAHSVTAFYDGANNVGGLPRGAATSNTETLTVTNADSTPPVITPNVVGTLGNNGWYRSDVSVTWSVTDAQSAITSTTGCGPSSVTADTAGTTFTCSAISSGGTSSQSVTIKRDASAPNPPTGNKTPPANAAGWNNSDVTVSFTDNGDIGPSGGVTCSSSVFLSAETAGTDLVGSCTDAAGNESTDTVVNVKIDKTGPSTTITLAPAAPNGNNDWYTSNVHVTVAATDAGGSGFGEIRCVVDPLVIPTSFNDIPTGCAYTGAGADLTANGMHVVYAASKDVADNSDTIKSASFKIDKTAPTTTTTLVPAAPNGDNGWYTSNVHVSVAATDNGGGSGIAETRCVLDPLVVPASFNVVPAGCAYSGAGADVTSDGTHVVYAASKDAAGNVEAVTSASFKIDKTNPLVAITSPSNGFSTIASTIAVNGTASDATSGIKTVTLNGAGTTNSATWTTIASVVLACGPNTLTATATDNAGNSASAAITVTRLCFTFEYLQPLEQSYMGGVVRLNQGKYGRVVPVKGNVNLGGVVQDQATLQGYGLTVVIGVNQVACTGGAATDAVEEYADAGQSSSGTNAFRWSLDGFWIYNLDTKAPPNMTMQMGRCYRLDAYVQDTASPVNKVKVSESPYAIFNPVK